jgi:hypothetical protein
VNQPATPRSSQPRQNSTPTAQPPGDVITPPSHAAALPHEDAWTPELRDALRRLTDLTTPEEPNSSR